MGHSHRHGEACDHGHDHHRHDHSGHSHTPAVTDDNERRVFLVMVITGLFMAVEAAGGFFAGSLALLADAGHMLTDTAALFLSWFAFRMGRRPADIRRSYGYHRFQILAAFANGLALFVIAGWIVLEAFGRLWTPQPVMGVPMMVIAGLGLIVNLVGFKILSAGDKHNLNVRGAALHVMGDLLGSVGAVAAALIIIATGWTPIDPILSVIVALLILRSAWSVVRQSSHILLEGAPDGIDAARIGAALGDVDGVIDVHHVHAWSLNSERSIVTLHVVLEDAADHNTALAAINGVLISKFGIEHATIQTERGARACDAAMDRSDHR